MNSKKLQTKDIITVGIYTAIMLVVRVISSFLGFVPIINAIITVPVCIAVGPVYMLFITKVKKFGMISIMATVTGLIMSLTGWQWYCSLFAIVLGVLADLITKKGEYKSFKLGTLGYCIYSLWWIAPILPVWIQSDFFANMRESMGVEFADAYQALMPIWMLPVLIIITPISALIGAYLGKSIMKKHFEKSGVA